MFDHIRQKTHTVLQIECRTPKTDGVYCFTVLSMRRAPSDLKVSGNSDRARDQMAHPQNRRRILRRLTAYIASGGVYSDIRRDHQPYPQIRRGISSRRGRCRRRAPAQHLASTRSLITFFRNDFVKNNFVQIILIPEP
jgi:hypothetical protein